MLHRLQIFYGIVAVLSLLSLAGIVMVHYSPNWVTFPRENGTPSYGLWKACSYFPDNEGANCRRYWDIRWKDEANLVHSATKAAASFFIFGMFFNLVLLGFVVFVAINAAKVDFYPGVPISLAAIIFIMYAIACSVMEWCVKERLIHHSKNHTNLPRDAPRENGPAAIGAWISFACAVVNFALGVLILVFKPTKAEIQKQFEEENFAMA